MTKRKKPDEISTKKDIGRLFEVIGVCILGVVAVLMIGNNIDWAVVLLFLVGASLSWGGWILLRLPSEHEKKEK